ncbi:WAP four-disulfide core domain protein 3 [Sphaerodactylus townsendi]|uniref:WAP four-disulfide core domain protein 3 n=1 Tax=Sphaerodactylus townsendi TaxID=933632 RepID=UPI00202713BC|nr:WAP four-disulfide core domain protein 3 [Sphaerodactylus townsendi]
MKPEALWWLLGLLVLRDGDASDYGEEKIGKAGYCPAFPSGLYQPPCTVECEADSECERSEKCCEFACRYSCTVPIADKPGMCPSPLVKKLRAPEPCLTTCVADRDCSGPEKCCKEACGQTCRLPLPEKPGKCPKKKPRKNAGPAMDTCRHDQECLGAEKCCFTGSSMNCLNVQPGGGVGPGGKRAARPWLWASARQSVAQWPRNGPSSFVCEEK